MDLKVGRLSFTARNYNDFFFDSSSVDTAWTDRLLQLSELLTETRDLERFETNFRLCSVNLQNTIMIRKPAIKVRQFTKLHGIIFAR